MPYPDRHTVQALRDLKGKPWSLDTLLILHEAMLDRSGSLYLSAVDILMELAKSSPEPVAISPLDLLARCEFTVASGYRLDLFELLLDLGTPEAERLVKDMLWPSARNEDFRYLLEMLARRGRLDLVRALDPSAYSQTKAKMIRAILAEHKECPPG